jgi:hypothetical protein
MKRDQYSIVIMVEMLTVRSQSMYIVSQNKLTTINFSRAHCAVVLPLTLAFKKLSLAAVRGWLHEQFSACDLLQIAYAIWCICDLVSDKNHFLSFFCSKSQMRFCVRTKLHMRFSVSAIWCAVPCPFTTRNHAPNCTANCTANRNTISQHHIACYV